MLFNSYGFVFAFLPLSLAGFHILGRFGRRFGAIWLAFSSLAFYAVWNPSYVLLLLGSICFNFGIGELLHASRQHPGRQRAWLAAGITANLAVLIYYKYLAALIGLTARLGLHGVHAPAILLPLGISFFTFTQIGYLIDVQQGVVQDRSPLNYMLFVTFFPHLIAGPILHNREIMPQFAEERTYRFSLENVAIGSVIFIIGLAKKCLLADPIAGQVAIGFSTPHLTLPGAWLLMLTYAVQLYFDFSGYTDMAIGIARMFNVRFPANFNSPYKATCVIDFWQRWHMTLTRLLTLYLFNPLALALARRRSARGVPINRRTQIRPSTFLTMTAFPLLVTMGLAGIWHGAGLKYLIFGLLHGVYLTINHAWRIVRPRFKIKPGRFEHFGNWVLTIMAISVALVFFRAPTMAVAFETVGAMAGAHGLGDIIPRGGLAGSFGPLSMIFAQHGPAAATAGLQAVEAAVKTGRVAILWLIVLAMPNSQQMLYRYQPVLGHITPARFNLLKWRPTARWAMATGVIGAFATMAIAGTTEFVYFQF
jgi:alginate O-acetyltransferase complex protein AlgI